ncbi:unnamed protein product [Amoebophrya sp. A120]|nr:unnamed protein product [Amoebophrya sp. A120]|eukprot:GSA120T00024784001.1
MSALSQKPTPVDETRTTLASSTKDSTLNPDYTAEHFNFQPDRLGVGFQPADRSSLTARESLDNISAIPFSPPGSARSSGGPGVGLNSSAERRGGDHTSGPLMFAPMAGAAGSCATGATAACTDAVAGAAATLFQTSNGVVRDNNSATGTDFHHPANPGGATSSSSFPRPRDVITTPVTTTANNSAFYNPQYSRGSGDRGNNNLMFSANRYNEPATSSSSSVRRAGARSGGMTTFGGSTGGPSPIASLNYARSPLDGGGGGGTTAGSHLLAHQSGDNNFNLQHLNTSTTSSFLNRSVFNTSIAVGSPGSTDAVLQKCRDTLELQARELERERNEKLEARKQKNEAEAALQQEKSAHQLLRARYAESENTDNVQRKHYEEQINSLEKKLDLARKEQQQTSTQLTLNSTELSSLRGVEERHQKTQAQQAVLQAKIETLLREKEDLQENSQKLQLEVTSLEHKLTQVGFEASQYEGRCDEKTQRLQQTEETLARTRSRISILEQQVQMERERTQMLEDKREKELLQMKEELRLDYEQKIRSAEVEKSHLMEAKEEARKHDLEAATEKGHRVEKQLLLRIKDLELQLDHSNRDRARLEESFRNHGSQAQTKIEQTSQELNEIARHYEVLQHAHTELKKQFSENQKSRSEDVTQLQQSLHDVTAKLHTLEEEKRHMAMREQELQRHHLVELDMRGQEQHRLQKVIDERRVEYEENLKKIEESSEIIRKELQSKCGELDQTRHQLTEVEKGKDLLVVDESRARWDLERKCENLTEQFANKEKEMQVTIEGLKVRWDVERSELRQFYERKIDSLQQKVQDLRTESTEVRKMIVGAAADLYNSYSSDLNQLTSTAGGGATGTAAQNSNLPPGGAGVVPQHLVSQSQVRGKNNSRPVPASPSTPSDAPTQPQVQLMSGTAGPLSSNATSSRGATAGGVPPLAGEVRGGANSFYQEPPRNEDQIRSDQMRVVFRGPGSSSSSSAGGRYNQQQRTDHRQQPQQDDNYRHDINRSRQDHEVPNQRTQRPEVLAQPANTRHERLLSGDSVASYQQQQQQSSIVPEHWRRSVEMAAGGSDRRHQINYKHMLTAEEAESARQSAESAKFKSMFDQNDQAFQERFQKIVDDNAYLMVNHPQRTR